MMRVTTPSNLRDQEIIYPAVNAASPRTSFQAASRKAIIFRDWKSLTLLANVMRGAIDQVLPHGSGEGEIDITVSARGAWFQTPNEQRRSDGRRGKKGDEEKSERRAREIGVRPRALKVLRVADP